MDFIDIAYILIPLWALIIDTIIGDPQSKYHPVVLIGNVINYYEKIFYYKKDSKYLKLFYGFLTVASVLLTVGLIGFVLIFLFAFGGGWGEIIISTLLLYICITPKSLYKASSELANLLSRQKIQKARFKLSWIVGRDTQDLDEGEITRATIETVAENTVDGIMAPLFYFALFGPLGALLYRAVNTMDSMLGYKNERYLYFGRFAARLDDICNYIPARLTFIIFVIIAFILPFADGIRAFLVGLRDAKKHPSPNGGYAEAPIAAALRIRLGGYNSYGGVVNFREYMGDALRPLKYDYILDTIIFMYVATLIGIIFTVLTHYLIYGAAIFL